MCLGKPSVSAQSVGGHRFMCLHKMDSSARGAEEKLCCVLVCVCPKYMERVGS